MSSCVLYSTPNPQVVADHIRSATLSDWLLQRHTANCGKGVEPVSASPQFAAFLRVAAAAQAATAEMDRPHLNE